jgi:hypothetical protein
MKDLKYSIPIDVIKVLKERVENAATTIHNCYSLSVCQLSIVIPLLSAPSVLYYLYSQ